MEYSTGHKTSPKNFKKSEIMLSIFLDHNGTKLAINYKKTGKLTNTGMCRLNNMLLYKELVRKIT